jgi:hypothetical protein
MWEALVLNFQLYEGLPIPATTQVATLAK